MIDIQYIREHPDLVKEKSQQKACKVDIDRLLELDSQRKKLLVEVESLRQRRNEIADSTKGQDGKPEQAQIDEGKEVKSKIAALEEALRPLEQEWLKLIKEVPNMPTDDVPVGASEDENVVTKTVGEPPKFDFEPKSDAELGIQRDIIDKDRAAKIAGSRFVYLKGGIVELQFALIQYVISTLQNESILKSIVESAGLKVSTKPFIPVLPPPMIRTDVYEATSRLNGSEVTYKLEDDDLWLNGSAEHSLCCMYMDETLEEADLPIRYLGYGTAFRREAGTYGKDMEGILRLHHFDKLEMEIFSTPETSYDEHLFLVAIQEYLTASLGISYRVLLKCTYDIGKPNARGVDIEMWMPSQGKYRETHSADLITDYQTRRLKTRIKRSDGSMSLAHTNDATAFAMSRTLKSIIENYQNDDGTIRVPQVLQNYMGGKQII